MNKQDTILNILKNKGMREQDLVLEDKYTFSGKSYFSEKLEKAVRGEAVAFEVKGENLGRCYNRYWVSIVNYVPGVTKGPLSNFGEVEPWSIENIDGVTVGNFKYEVDSSD